MSSAKYPSSGIRRSIDDDLEAAGIHPAIFPHDDRLVDPIYALQVFQSELQSLPKTAKVVRMTDFRDAFDDYGNSTLAKVMHTLCEFTGSWVLSGTDAKGRAKFVNPDYIHLDHLNDEHLVSDDDRRLELLAQYAGYGIIDLKDIAPRFGLSESGIESVVERHNFPWAELRQEGRERMARTWVACRQHGYSWEDLRKAFQMPVSTMKTWTTRNEIDYSKDHVVL